MAGDGSGGEGAHAVEDARRSLATGPDVWSCAVQLWRAVARSEGMNAATATVRQVLERLDEEAARDLVVALAVMPRFAVGSSVMSSTETLDRLSFEMAWAWSG